MAGKFTVVLFCTVFPVCAVGAGPEFNVDFEDVMVDNVDVPTSSATQGTVATKATAVTHDPQNGVTVKVRTNYSCGATEMPGQSVVLDDNSVTYDCSIKFEGPELDSGLVQMSFDFMVCKHSANSIHLSLKDELDRYIAAVQYVNSDRLLRMVEYEPAGNGNASTPIGAAGTYKEDTVHHLDIVLDLDSKSICFALDGKDLGSDHALPSDAKFATAMFNTPAPGVAKIALDNVYLGKVILTCGEGLSSPCDDDVDDDIRLAAVQELVRRPVSGPARNILLWRLFALAKDDLNSEVRGAATSALVAIGAGAHPRIRDLLNDQSEEGRRIRRTTITALRSGEVIDPQTESLIAAADPEPTVYGGPASLLTNGGFENGMTGWTVTCQDGAVGSAAITTMNVHGGAQALQVTKDNGMGYMLIRSNKPVNLPKSSTNTTCRLWFRSDDAPLESQLLLRVEDADGALTDGDSSRATWLSQTSLRNAAPRQWDKRVIMLTAAQTGNPYFVQILLFGNPCTITIDDVTLPAPNRDFVISDPTPSQFLPGWENIDDILETQPNFTGTVAKCNDKVTIRVAGGAACDDIGPVLHKPVTNSRADYTAFEDAGVSLQTVFIRIGSNSSFKKWCYRGKIVGVPTVWPTAAKQSYDFSYAIEQLKEAVSKAPDSYFIIDFWVVWPDDYVDNNPETAWKDKYGNRAYGNSLVQPVGFNDDTHGTWTLPAGCIWLPSPYQDKPIDDAGDVLKKFMQALKGTPYHKRVVGCCISGGHDGQFYIKDRDKDYSPAGKVAWQEWLKVKYKGNDAALGDAWNWDDPNFLHAEVPVDPGDPESKMFFDPNHETNLRDYREFVTERMWKIKEKLAQYAKQGAGKSLIGLSYNMGGGMAADFRPLFRSPHLDGCIAQPAYWCRRPGHIGGIRAAYDSFTKHGKLMIKEMDTRSWIRETAKDEIESMRFSTPMSLNAFKKLCRKEIGEQIAQHQGWWYYDISDNAFRDPDLMQEIAQARRVADSVRQAADSFKPDAVAVYSQDSYLWGRPTIYGFRNLPTWILGYLEMELATSGVPMDRMYIEDLIENDPNGDAYKMYVFMNCYALTGAQLSYIESELKTDNKTLVWHYAPGYVDIDNNKLDANKTSSLVGMTVTTNPLAPMSDYRVLASAPGSHPLLSDSRPILGVGDTFLKQFYQSDAFIRAPRFVINDAQASTLGIYDNHEVGLAVRDMGVGTKAWRSIYASALGALSSEVLNNAAVDAGCYVATGPGFAGLEMNGRFLSLHALKSGDYNIQLPSSCRVVDPDTGRVLGIGDEIDLSLSATESKWLQMFAVGDIDHDGDNDLNDLTELVEQWHQFDCGACQGADLNLCSKVDFLLNKLCEVMEEAGFKKSVVYSKYPIRDGYSATKYYPPEQSAPKPRNRQIINEVYVKGKLRKKLDWELEQFTGEQLDDEHKKLILYFTGGIWDMKILGEFLRQHCSIPEPEKLLWEDITAALIVFAQREGVTPEMISKYPKQMWTCTRNAGEFKSMILAGTGQETAIAFLTVVDLAKLFGVDTETLRIRLGRYRTRHALDTELFVESQDRGKNKPKYAYNLKRIQPIIEKMKNKETPVKRTSEEK